MVCIFLAASATARERVTACAQSKREDGSWSQGYKVEATVLSSQELFQATRQFYEFGTYVVIFWAENQASIIHLDYGLGTLTAFPAEGEDQQKRRWQVAKWSALCM